MGASDALDRVPCGSCGANLEWDPGEVALTCPYCGHVQAVLPPGGIPGGAVVEHPLSEALSDLPRDLGFALRKIECRTCAAITDLDPGVYAGTCAFCGSPQVGEVQSRGAVRPESLIPFLVDRDRAAALFDRWLGKLWFRPSDMRRLARLGQVRGIYLPCYTFDAQADSSWTAMAGYHYYETQTYTAQENGRTVTRTRQVQKTRWVPASGHHSGFYDDVLVGAGRGLEPKELAAVEPFATQALVPYRPEFLAGFGAEEHGMEPRDAWPRAEATLHGRERAACAAQVPGDTHRALDVHTVLTRQTFKSVLLPVYVAPWRYRDRAFRVVINGQTEKVAGTAPWSVVKIVLAVLLLVAVVAGIAWWRGQGG